jgi:taurine dioxygenase
MNGMSTDTFEYISLAPVTPVIGAEVGGIDLHDPADDALRREIHAALMRHKVLFFRDQDIEPPEFAAFARGFGRLRRARKAAFELLEGAPEVSVLINDRERPPNVNHFHPDGIFRENPEFASILHARECPAAGGDTIFVNMVAAYEGLDDEMKAYLEGRTATHDFMKLHGSPQKARSWKGDNAARMAAMAADHPPVSHPMVQIHPVTGEKSLYVSESFTSHIDGVDRAESDAKLLALYRHYERPEYQCRFHWRPHSIALWDNRSTLHYAVADYWPEKRRMNRMTIETDFIGCGEA